MSEFFFTLGVSRTILLLTLAAALNAAFILFRLRPGVTIRPSTGLSLQINSIPVLAALIPMGAYAAEYFRSLHLVNNAIAFAPSTDGRVIHAAFVHTYTPILLGVILFCVFFAIWLALGKRYSEMSEM